MPHTILNYTRTMRLSVRDIELKILVHSVDDGLDSKHISENSDEKCKMMASPFEFMPPST